MKRTVKMILKSLLVAFVCTAFFACDDDKEGSMYQVLDDNTAGVYLSEREDFSEWVKILKYSNLYNAINYASDAFTLFVPNNEALQTFYTKKGVAGIEELGQTYARELVLQHVVEDSIQADAFILLTSVQNLSENTITIEIDSVNAGHAILNGEAVVYEMGVHTFNALLYYCSDVMTPLVETVYDRVAQDNRYSIFAEALTATGWDKELNTLADTVDLLGVKQINKRFYTLLAVSDASFQADGVKDFADLQTKLGSEGNLTDSANAVYQYVAYHLLNNEYTLADLQSFNGSDTTRIWGTKAPNQVMTVTVDSLSEEQYFLNLLGESASFVQSGCDVKAKNGMVHEINHYLPIWEPAQATVVWDLADYSEVKNLVGPEIYQPVVCTSESKIGIAAAECYDVVMSEAGSANSSLYRVTYITCKDGGKWDEAYHKDRVAFNVGYMGSVAMKTPTIVGGKYKVEISMIYTSDQSFMRTMSDGSGGMIHISMDGKEEKNIAPYTTITKSTAGIYSTTLYEEIDFEQTSDHLFKFVVMDPAATSNAKFSLQFDCITFTPINE